MNKYYPNLFSPIKLGRRTAKNRIFMSAMGDNMAEPDGSISDQHIAYYAERAKGGAGVILTGCMGVDDPQGKATPSQPRLSDPKYQKNLCRLATEVHRYGALLIPQILHAGEIAKCTENVKPVSVSPVQGHEDEYEVLTLEKIRQIQQAFVQAAVIARLAHCDGVEIHAAHMYLISQFLLPRYNRRTDEYGGSLENRARFGLEVIRAVRAAVGPDFIVGVRAGIHFVNFPDGLTEEDSILLCKWYEEAGADFIDVSASLAMPGDLIETMNRPEGNRAKLTDSVRGSVKVPMGVLGKLRSPEFCEGLLAQDRCDFVVIGRQLICDPYWPDKAKAGRTGEILPCLSCSEGCSKELNIHNTIHCVLNPEAGYEFYKKLEPAPDRIKKVVVVGGGLSGMQAAITAASRGHEVVLAEAADRLGGQMHLAAAAPGKSIIGCAEKWFEDELQRRGVKVCLGTRADLAWISETSPDEVILATGAVPVTLPIPGIEKGIQAWDLLSGKAEAPKGGNVVIVGGGIVGCEIAECLMADNDVTILEMTDVLAAGLFPFTKMDMMAAFQKYGVKPVTGARVKAIGDTVVCERAGEEISFPADCVIIALGQKSFGRELIEELEDAGFAVTAVGDLARPSDFKNATSTGFFAGLNL